MVFANDVSGFQRQMANRALCKTACRGGKQYGGWRVCRSKQRAGDFKICIHAADVDTDYLCLSVCAEVFCTGHDDWGSKGMMYEKQPDKGAENKEEK